MPDATPTPERPPGQTGGSSERPSRGVEAPATVDLTKEAATLRGESAWHAGDRNAVTLVKEGDLRQVLTVLKRGAILREHRVPGTAAIQVLSGRLRLHAGGDTVELGPGQLVTLDAETAHDAEALEEAAFLISIAWRGGQRGDDARR